MNNNLTERDQVPSALYGKYPVCLHTVDNDEREIIGNTSKKKKPYLTF